MRSRFFYDSVVYQIYPRSFLDTNNDGLGDIPGIILKLDYLKDLGINTIWLSPVFDSPQVDNGYDISSYYDIYPPFGTLDDMKKLIEECHKRDIKLLMDLVVNHTSDKHPWFIDLINNKDSKYKDYYIVRKGKNNGKKPPNNWGGFFGEGAWEKLPDRDEYYLHLFAKGQPDLNWENVEVRKEIKKILKFWLDLGIDGYRCDVINLISKKQDFKSAFPLLGLTGHKNYINGPRVHEFIHELYTDVLSNYDTFMVGETVFCNPKKALEFIAQDRGELDMVFSFEHTDTDNFFGIKYFYKKFSLKKFKKVINKWQSSMYQKGWNSLFIENHDQRRSSGRFLLDNINYHDESAKMLGLVYFMLQGTPYIYQGQEIGMTNANFKSFKETRDIEISNMLPIMKKVPFASKIMMKHALEVSRDNARTPMCWNNKEYAGFSIVEPWIKVNENKDLYNVEEAMKNPNSIYHFYQKMIEFRKNNEVIRYGNYLDITKNDPNIYIYLRRYKDDEVVVIANFKAKNIKSKLLKKFKDYDLVLSNYETHDIESLKPYECRLLKKRL